MGDQGSPSHPKPSGPEVEFYLGRSVRGVNIPGDGVPEQVVRVNGYPYVVQFGKKNKVPKEVYDIFVNSKSRSVRTLEQNEKRAPRSADNLTLEYNQWEPQSDYEIELIKEGK
jgi:hypothetical protein